MQCFTPLTGSDARHTEVYATECLVAMGGGGTTLHCESTSVWRGRRKVGGRWVALSGVAVIASYCIRLPRLWKKTRASARKLVDLGG